MNILRSTGLSVVCVLAAGVAQAATFSFEAILNGAQAVPGSTPVSTATGTATMTLDDSDESLSFSLNVIGISTGDLMNIATFGPVHIHAGVAGATGPVAVPFIPAGDAGGNATYSDTSDGFDLVSDRILLADSGINFADFLSVSNAQGYYINIHTAAVASGEIRGQLAPVPLPAGAVLLLGALGGLGMMRKRQKAA